MEHLEGTAIERSGKVGLNQREEIDLYIRELQQSVAVAAVNYDVWWTYKNQDTRPQYIEVMRRYNEFFRTSIHAHFVALVIALYRIYEQRADTFNIPKLVEILTANNWLTKESVVKLDSLQKEAKPIWKKLGVLRNRVFGHRSKAHSVDSLFKEAAITPSEIKRLIELTKILLNVLTHAWDQSFHAFNLEAREDTIGLLNDLVAFHRSRKDRG